MKTLFVRFEELSSEAQSLLEQGIQRMRDGYALDKAFCDTIASALAALRTAYDDISQKMPEFYAEDSFPDRELSLHEYEEAWQNSVVRRNSAVRSVLEEFIRVYSDEKRYMDAIEEHLLDARSLLAGIGQPESQGMPDVSFYQLFLDGVKTDPNSDEELMDRIWDRTDFTRTLVRGLMSRKYRIREAVAGEETKESIPEANADEDTADSAVPADDKPLEPIVDPSASENASGDNFDEETTSATPASEKTNEDGEPTHVETPAARKPDPEPVTADKQDEAETSAATEEFIHPTNPIRPSKLPSDQKLKEIINRTRIVFGYLVDKLVFLGLMDESSVFEAFTMKTRPITREQCVEAFSVLERKGLLCTYTYEGRSILCFTELMDSCLQKTSLSSVLKRSFGLKTLGKMHIVGKQDMPVSYFRHMLSLADECEAAFAMLSKNEMSAKAMPTASWISERGYFVMNYTQEDGSILPLRIVAEESFSATEPNNGEGLFCAARVLPEMDNMDSGLYYCLTPHGLYHWTENRWNLLIPNDTLLPSKSDGSIEPEHIVEDTEEPVTTEMSETSELVDLPAENDIPITDTMLDTHQADSPEQVSTEEKKHEGLWLDDLSETPQVVSVVGNAELSEFASAELAEHFLKTSANGAIPSDDSMAMLIHRMLSEGVRSADIHNYRDQIVEALALARVLSTSRTFPRCREIYNQLHVALPFFRDNALHTGIALSDTFAEETEYTPVAKLCAYIYGMLFPTHAHDHTFTALCNGALDSFDTHFHGFDLLKPLYHKAMEGLRLVPTAFSAANLAALTDSKMHQEQMNSLRAKARELMILPTIKFMINGVPELIDLCFGRKTELYTALEIVAENESSMRDFVEKVLLEYSKDGNIDTALIERLLDSQWGVAAQKYSSRRMGIKYEARKHLINAYVDRLTVLREWLEETDTESLPDLEKLRAIRSEILRIAEAALVEAASLDDSAARSIVRAFLDLICSRLQNNDNGITFNTLLRSGTLVVEHGALELNEALNEIEFAEPWRMMLQHIACTDYDLQDVYEAILHAPVDSTLYDNLFQLEAIGALLHTDPVEYIVSGESLRDAINSANLQAQNFREKLEISYAYNRISETERERLAILADPETSDFQQYFYGHKAFGCWRAFLNALRAQIRAASQHSLLDVQSQLEQAKAMLHEGEESPLLKEAERLMVQEQNFAVAEDYIHRFRNGERGLPYESNDGAMNYYLDFISKPNYKKLFDFCDRRRESTLAKLVMQYIESYRPEGWTRRHIDNAQTFIEKWPVRKQNVTAASIQEFFSKLGFSVENCSKTMRHNEVCFTLSVNKSRQNLADYRHPISMFGTQMKPQIEVACLFGKRTAKQLIDDACSLGISGTFIVLLDATLSAVDRRTMAQYFYTQKNVGQASFLVIDRVLALYLSIQADTERLPAMLQCTLPYTIYQPFTNGSGSTADEMFFGRVNELASIRDMTGTSIVYGGRQLGKTALLERAMHLDHNPGQKEFAIMASFKGCRGEKSFLDILVDACNEVFEKSGFKLSICSTVRDFASQIRRLIDGEQISILRLLLDETDDFLDSISGTSYSEIQSLIELQRGSNRRFKFVFAGLHNVCRAINATRNNGLFGQLGQPLCVKPLTPADARNLLVRPLRYLGFRVSSETHIDTILTNTNYYPGIIQFFGYTLVQTLASQYSHYYDPVRGNPPFELHDEQLASIMNSRDLNESIKERLRWTLGMDGRYYMLARCIAVLYHLSENNYSMISNGFDVAAIREIARDMFNIHCLVSLSETEIKALLDEMEEMGILSRPETDKNRYLLRRRSFIDVIGTSLDALEHDIMLYNEEETDNA